LGRVPSQKGVSVLPVVIALKPGATKFCEWEHQLARQPASEAFVASLPPMP
jgi:hypothetical protein